MYISQKILLPFFPNLGTIETQHITWYLNVKMAQSEYITD